ncbi:MAG: hypothetical protein K2Q26_13020 [Bdellovibrionales bacterium]|nr:hypothetical protein [Bdellovibrionales bacterium]
MEFAKLRKIFDTEQSMLGDIIKSFPWQDKDAYAGWLANSNEYVANSTRVLALAGGTMPRHLTSFSNRFIKHSAEELGHEKLLELDVRGLGKNMNQIEITDEMYMFHRSLYYWISPAASPIGLFGWVLALEGVAVNFGEWIYNEVKATHGPKSANFLKVHSAEDPDHLDKAFSSIKLLDSNDLNLVAMSTVSYCRQYGRVLERIKSDAGQRRDVA